jgi:hypothetical protein
MWEATVVNTVDSWIGFEEQETEEGESYVIRHFLIGIVYLILLWGGSNMKHLEEEW